MRNYAAAKALLFASSDLKHVILNGDDAASAQMQAMVSSPQTHLWHYGLTEKFPISATDVQLTIEGTTFQLKTPWGNGAARIRAIGQFNVYNTLALITSLLCSEVPFQQVLDVLPYLSIVPGRMETVFLKPWIVVDYSHKPEALTKALQIMRYVLTKGRRLIVVFGCGGERDQAKRPMMGE